MIMQIDHAAELPFKVKLLPGGKAPKRQTDGAGGYDCYARCHDHIYPYDLPAGELPTLIPLGFAVAVPRGWVGLLRTRSGLLKSHGLEILGGVIDSDYRGEVMALMRAVRGLDISPGDRIAQLVIVPHCRGLIEVVDELPETNRGSGGLGSTGV